MIVIISYFARIIGQFSTRAVSADIHTPGSVLTSSSYNRSVKIRLVVTCRLQTCYNLLKQLAANLWITSFDNQLATSLLTTCNRLIVNKRYIQLARNRMAVNKLSQAMRTHPDIGLLMISLLKDVKGLVAA